MMVGDMAEDETKMMVEESHSGTAQIDPEKARFPCCVVWTPFPLLSWLIPFIGHIGICKEDGVITDFAGPNVVCVDDFAFGPVARYFQINKDKDCCIPNTPSGFESEDQSIEDNPGSSIWTWDDAIQKSTQEFQHYLYRLLTCNCHSFVANNLNRLQYQSGGWNVVNVAALVLFKGQWVSTGAMIQSFLPFCLLFILGFVFGGFSFLHILIILNVVFVSWFVIGTYSCKNMITL